MKQSLTPRPLNTQTPDGYIVFVQNKKPLLSGNGALKKLIAEQIKKRPPSHYSLLQENAKTPPPAAEH